VTQRIPSRQLYLLRNAIPIDQLIRALPALSAKESEGTFRFLCPLCSGFNTATNPKTNLARCFRCNRNFNTIDLVMQVQNVNFKDAVAALSSRLSGALSRPDLRQTATSTSRDSFSSFRSISQILECALAKTRSSLP
jgi:DNA primase